MKLGILYKIQGAHFLSTKLTCRLCLRHAHTNNFAWAKWEWNSECIYIMIPVSKGQKSCSCLHDKAFELGTRQIWESSDLRSKSADFEYLEDCGSSVAIRVSNECQKTFWHSYHIMWMLKSDFYSQKFSQTHQISLTISSQIPGILIIKQRR